MFILKSGLVLHNSQFVVLFKYLMFELRVQTIAECSVLVSFFKFVYGFGIWCIQIKC